MAPASCLIPSNTGSRGHSKQPAGSLAWLVHFLKGVVGAMQAGDRPTVDQLRRDATKGLLAFLPTAASKLSQV
ncbi:hypothetical protein OEZ85_002517 [Tetradesmus obliquus]|uniref:Glycolipid transfer protein domain-containing protein n=1 Tax=Tetradesmus obliquus TaxID=3088 RepID=A0ABY8TY68_TETOB|nr:hypothetical protein OEZ85_002517 [Tetradesmus obliquus]